MRSSRKAAPGADQNTKLGSRGLALRSALLSARTSRRPIHQTRDQLLAPASAAVHTTSMVFVSSHCPSETLIVNC